jgi:hypothetical protein
MIAELSHWLSSFRALHARVRDLEATPADREVYRSQRNELDRSLTSAQNLTVASDEPGREHFRVSQAFGLELQGQCRAVTHDISLAGFSAVVAGSFEVNQELPFSVLVGHGEAPVRGRARVISWAKEPLGICARVSFVITDLEPGGAERLGLALFDAALARLE